MKICIKTEIFTNNINYIMKSWDFVIVFKLYFYERARNIIANTNANLQMPIGSKIYYIFTV
jgi:hypothetical protein